MEIKIKEDEFNPEVGDLIISKSSGLSYLIVKDNNIVTNKYTLICLDESEVACMYFDNIRELIEYYFEGLYTEVIKNKNILITNTIES